MYKSAFVYYILYTAINHTLVIKYTCNTTEFVGQKNALNLYYFSILKTDKL